MSTFFLIHTFLESLAAEQLASSTSKKKSKKKPSALAPPEPEAPESRPDTSLSSVELKAILKKLHDRMSASMRLF